MLSTVVVRTINSEVIPLYNAEHGCCEDHKFEVIPLYNAEHGCCEDHKFGSYSSV